MNPVFGGFETRLKFIKFGLRSCVYLNIYSFCGTPSIISSGDRNKKLGSLENSKIARFCLDFICFYLILKGVFAKNGKGYRSTSDWIRYRSLLILHLSAVPVMRKWLKPSQTFARLYKFTELHYYTQILTNSIKV